MSELNSGIENQVVAVDRSAIDVIPFDMSENIGKLAEALSKAQGEMRHPQKNKIAKVGTYSYNYADLADVIDAIREPFARYGLSFCQIPFQPKSGKDVGIITLLMHSSGQWIQGTLVMPAADKKPQTIGSAITYGRRYSLAPMAGITSDDDDDGNVAQGNDALTQRRPGREQSSGVSRPTGMLPERTANMLAAFTALGVTQGQLEAHCGGTSLAALKDADFATLKELYNDVKLGNVEVAKVGRSSVG